MTNIFKTENFLFDVENHDIRINGNQIKMVGTFEDPYFCGKDVADGEIVLTQKIDFDAMNNEARKDFKFI